MTKNRVAEKEANRIRKANARTKLTSEEKKQEKEKSRYYKAKSKLMLKLTANWQMHKRQLQKGCNSKKAEYRQNKETRYTRHDHSRPCVQNFRDKVKIDFTTSKENKSLQKTEL